MLCHEKGTAAALTRMIVSIKRTISKHPQETPIQTELNAPEPSVPRRRRVRENWDRVILLRYISSINMPDWHGKPKLKLIEP